MGLGGMQCNFIYHDQNSDRIYGIAKLGLSERVYPQLWIQDRHMGNYTYYKETAQEIAKISVDD